MSIFSLVLIALVSIVYSQTYVAFTADFYATAPQWGTGYFTGKLSYDWGTGFMKLAFDNADGYTEFYQFNVDKGYNEKILTGQFTYQYLYKTSNSCPCETVALQYAMPPLFVSSVTQNTLSGLPYWILQTTAATDPAIPSSIRSDKSDISKWFVNFDIKLLLGNGATKPYSLASTYYKDAAGKPAGFSINDYQQRTFTLTNVVEAATKTLGLTPPASSACKCGKLLDLVISLDRSGSIPVKSWNLEYAFVKNLTGAFDYGDNKANVGIVNWNAAQWTSLDLTVGTSTPVVNNAVNNMVCCGTPPTTNLGSSCCCCGTPIGGGVWAAGNMLLSSNRPKATKVAVVLTDGCQNHLWVPTQGSAGVATPCSCGSESACANDTTCVGDIDKWYQWTSKNVQGVKIIAVGVGDSSTICINQLNRLAGGDPTNVYNPQSWDDLLTIVQTISATACTTNNTLCPSCCGICTCGVCYPAVKCFDQDKCNLGVLDTSSQCCRTEPVVCTPGPCQTATCLPASGCQVNAVTCKPPPQGACYEWYCNSTSINCATRPLSPLPISCQNIVIPECVTDGDCGGKSKCQNDICVNGTCKHTTVVCPASDQCQTTVCKPTAGCVTTTKPCNDNNLCTTDTCDGKVKGGCVYTNITCPNYKDPCLVTYCDPAFGCLNKTSTSELPVCSNITASNCSQVKCSNKTCFLQYYCLTPPPTSSENPPAVSTVVLASSITGAAIAGIVIAGVVLVVGLGGGAAVAIAGAAGAGGVVAVSSNPLYQGSGTSGTNPLAGGT